MRVLVVGATGGSGRATVETLAARGHTVTALARGADAGRLFPTGVAVVTGDATSASDLDRAVAGQDAVVVAQPVALTDDVEADAPFVSLDGTVRSMAISRRRVAAFLAEAAESARYNHQVVALS